MSAKPEQAEAITGSFLVARTLSPRSAVERAFRDHFDEIYRYLARRVGPGIAEDLAAETFVEALKSYHRYDPRKGALRPWLYGIATRMLRRHARKEARQLRAYAKSGVDPVVGSDARDFVESALSGATARDIARALARLSQRERDLLLLYAWADLTYTELALAFNVPVGTVRSQLSRTRARLRELLTTEG
jgi:RNA polymerase sigma factor (sigma-70 family)